MPSAGTTVRNQALRRKAVSLATIRPNRHLILFVAYEP